MFERVLIASDFSKHSEQIVNCVGEIPGVKEVILLNVLYKSEIGRTWSPGDDKIVFQSDRTGQLNIWMVGFNIESK